MKALSTYLLGLALTLSLATVGICQPTLSDSPLVANASKNDDTEGKKDAERTTSDKIETKSALKKKKKEACKRKEAEEDETSSNLYFTTP